MSETYWPEVQDILTITGNIWLAQTFMPLQTHEVEFLKVKVSTAMVSCTLWVSIQNLKPDGTPTGVDLTNSSWPTLRIRPWPDFNSLIFQVNRFRLVAGVKYALVVHLEAPVLVGFFFIRYKAPPSAYPRGKLISSVDAGHTWLTHDQGDLCFAEWGDPPVPHSPYKPPVENFAPLAIQYAHTEDSIIISLPTNVPCHLTCYYTTKKPLKHPLSRTIRGITVPWSTYFCFIAWHAVEQLEPGDTLYHTFEIPDWSYCQRKWFTIRGNVDDALSPSIGPIFEHHHPGVTEKAFTIQIAHNNNDYRRLNSTYQACPTVCPPLLEAGYFYAHRLHAGCGMRFINVPLPRYTTITRANLIFTCWQTQDRHCPYTRISAEQEDNPPDFSLDDWLSAHARWQNSGIAIDWNDIPAWELDHQYISPDISQVIQELVSRPFWFPDNALVLFFNDWDERTGHLPYGTRRAYSHNVNPAKAVKLFIAYES